MTDWNCNRSRPLFKVAAAASLLWAAGTAAIAQSVAPVGTPAAAPNAAVGSGLSISADPNPYFIGLRQSFTHDSNVYRIPDGPSDTYSSTTLLAGFSQPISRQRVFGDAAVSYNRYFSESQLNNTSYDLSAGIDWETIMRLSGSLRVGLGRSLSSPAASAGTPTQQQNVANRRNIDGVVRWGGASTFSLEAAAGYARLDYSADQYVGSETRSSYASLGGFYRPSPLLRVGLAGRVSRDEQPNGLQVAPGQFESNTVTNKSIDLLADYELGGRLSAQGRLSYTTQNNSGVDGADFSGFTGGLNLNYRATGKTVVNVFANRDAGFNSRRGSLGGVSTTGTTAPPVTGTTPAIPPGTTTPTSTTAVANGLYENNQITTSYGIGIGYAATAKITANLGASYSRAKLVSTAAAMAAGPGSADTTDVVKSIRLGANYAFSRSLDFACSIAYEKRNVSGGVDYSYSASLIGCSGQYTWR